MSGLFLGTNPNLAQEYALTLDEADSLKNTDPHRDTKRMEEQMQAAPQLPKPGQEWPGNAGSTYAGVSTDKEGKLYALVLLADKAPSDVTWKAANAWADHIGADLPSRAEALLLFTNVPDKLAKEWHWTNESYGESYAWGCGFSDGYVYNRYRSSEGSAVAVRRFFLESFDPFEGLTKRAAASTAQLRKAAVDLLAACDNADAALEQVAS